RFATVSAVVGFREWLERNPQLMDLSSLEAPRWFEDEALSEELKKHVVPLCAYYLLHARQGKEPRDSVARFHLRNGARLERLNWLGDTSAAGMQRSAGLMANYVYRLPDVERNHEMYTTEYKIAASYEIESLARQFKKTSTG